MPTQHHSKEVLPPRPLIQEGGKVVGEVSHQLTTVELEGDGQGMLAAISKSPRFVGNSNSRDSTANFEAIIKDIDNEILEDIHNPNPIVTKIIQNLNRGGEDTIKEDSKIGDGGELEKGLEFDGFQVGWAEKKVGTKGAKSRKKEGPKKSMGLKNVTCGPNNKPNVSQGPKKGNWTRLPHMPKENMEVEAQGSEVGMKSKTEGLDGSKEGKVENEKKQKVEEETKTLSMLFATHLGVAKVAKQPRQPQ